MRAAVRQRQGVQGGHPAGSRHLEGGNQVPKPVRASRLRHPLQGQALQGGTEGRLHRGDMRREHGADPDVGLYVEGYCGGADRRREETLVVQICVVLEELGHKDVGFTTVRGA